MWAANFGSSTVTKIHAGSAITDATVAVTGNPRAIAFDGALGVDLRAALTLGRASGAAQVRLSFLRFLNFAFR